MDRDNLATLVAAHQAEVYRYLRYLGAARELAEDLVQDTFLAAFGSTKPPDMQDVRGRAAWLRAIARHRFLSDCRRRRANPVAVDSDGLEQAEARWSVEFLRHDGGRGYRTALRSCVAKLPEAQRQALDLRYRQRKSRAEMAAALSLSEDGVKSMLRRTRAALAAAIKRQLEVEEAPCKETSRKID